MFNFRLARSAVAGLLFAFSGMQSLPATALSGDAPPAAAPAPAASQSLERRVTDLTREVDELKTLVHQLQEQLVKATSAPPAAPPAAASPAAPAASPTAAAAPTAPSAASTATAVSTTSTTAPPSGAAVAAYLPHGVTINALLDTYYEYNFNSPVGRVNYLRAYDVSSNSFSLNQADLLVESART